MKKLISTLIAVIAGFILSAGVSAEIYLDDSADFLTAEEETELQEHMKDLENLTGWNVGIVTDPSEYYNYDFAYKMADSRYTDIFGYEDGILYQMSGVHDYYLMIITQGTATDIITSSKIEQILDAAEPSYIDYDEYGSAVSFIYKAESIFMHSGYTLVDGRLSFDIWSKLDIVSLFFPGFLIGAVIAGIGIIIIVARYKTHPKISASAYLDNNNVNFYRRSDVYLRTDTTRVPISSGGGGGGHGGGGGGRGGGGRGGHR
ncbi:MAG: TPM domain-containing protein [Ruminococcus sp.]|jgi:uncharacterized membrane protein YgcG|nr:TPM domain-containing protein [Ruminococcus sp.]